MVPGCCPGMPGAVPAGGVADPDDPDDPDPDDPDPDFCPAAGQATNRPRNTNRQKREDNRLIVGLSGRACAVAASIRQ
jgi:hypothetical protein